jgi:hypothetical protein
MKSQFQLWRQKTKDHPISSMVISILIISVIALIVVIILGYCFDWDWTGLGSYTPPAKDSNFQRGKTLWDWLQLLIIPAVLAVAGYVFTLTTSQNERRAIEQRSKTEHDIATDNQRETALQDYINKLSELLLEKKLRKSQLGEEVRNIARIRTLTVLLRLDDKRKGSILLFLYESGLIEKHDSIINLSGADMFAADLGAADLIPTCILTGNSQRHNRPCENFITERNVV